MWKIETCAVLRSLQLMYSNMAKAPEISMCMFPLTTERPEILSVPTETETPEISFCVLPLTTETPEISFCVLPLTTETPEISFCVFPVATETPKVSCVLLLTGCKLQQNCCRLPQWWWRRYCARCPSITRVYKGLFPLADDNCTTITVSDKSRNTNILHMQRYIALVYVNFDTWQVTWPVPSTGVAKHVCNQKRRGGPVTAY